jgi:alkanesulfonate monooxygenase SsuD/methylene tetrahydromethanopterin reductase-like flavin-dependent oxidoreductase (luciferase family)
VHSPGYVADTDDEAIERAVAALEGDARPHRRERGWGPTTTAEFERMAGPDGALYAGSPRTVAAKIARTVRALDASRFALKYSAGTLPHGLMMASIERYGTEVIPEVRRLLADEAEPAAAR